MKNFWGYTSGVQPEPFVRKSWHALATQEILTDSGVTESGMTGPEAERRLIAYGKNTLPVRKSPGAARIFLLQFKSPLIFILLIAAVISAWIGDTKDAAFIILVLLINALIGAYQEYRAELGALALQTLIRGSARVIRDKKEQTLLSDNLVPGDIVHLDAGAHVPADMRILHAANLTIDEAILTGESVAAEKGTGILPQDTLLPDQKNMAFAGTTVMTGIGIGVIVATGSNTEVGQIARSVSQNDEVQPPLIRQMERFSFRIGIAVLFCSAIMGAIILSQGVPLVEVFFFAVALAISAIPEGLPVSITVALSIAATRMSRRNVIVRRLAAVEGLGSCTAIVTDKTGTLTLNEQTARMVVLPTGKFYHTTGSGYQGTGTILTRTNTVPEETELANLVRLTTAAVQASEGSLFTDLEEWVHSGDAMDVATLALAHKLGLNPDEIRCCGIEKHRVPFDSVRQYAAAYVRTDRGPGVAAKGGAEAILRYCTTMMTASGDEPLNAASINQAVAELALSGYRVLAVAEGAASDPGTFDSPDGILPEGLTLLGLIGFIDPVRPDVPAAILECQGAGIDVIMCTGDHPATAMTIARTLAIASEESQVMTGTELAARTASGSETLSKDIAGIRVFARMTPDQKYTVVDALQKAGHFVAVTGDGVNDAPALRHANIGVAMGSGSDVAKDISSLIVTDDNFSSIVKGVEEGRFAYDNIRKVTYLLISTGFAEVILFMLSLSVGLPLPLLAIQLLWLNLVTNGIQDVALAFEKGEGGAMQRKPRPSNEGIINRLMMQETLLSAATIGLVAFGTWYWLLAAGWDETAARNMVILLMVLLENVHALNCRSEYRSAFKVPLRANLLLIAGIVAAQGIHILSMYSPVMQDILQISPVTLEQWGLLLCIAFVVLVVMEIFKRVRTQLPGRSEAAAGDVPGLPEQKKL